MCRGSTAADDYSGPAGPGQPPGSWPCPGGVCVCMLCACVHVKWGALDRNRKLCHRLPSITAVELMFLKNFKFEMESWKMVKCLTTYHRSLKLES